MDGAIAFASRHKKRTCRASGNPGMLFHEFELAGVLAPLRQLAQVFAPQLRMVAQSETAYRFTKK